jgi:hypothetical protein
MHRAVGVAKTDGIESMLELLVESGMAVDEIPPLLREPKQGPQICGW